MDDQERPTKKFYGLFQYVFDYYNKTLFDSAIQDCLIVITRRKSVMGHYSFKRWFSISDQETDELAINPSQFLKHPLIEICQTVVHEMCHGWQYHYGTPSRAGYHNREWSEKMQEVGLMPSGTGNPGGRKVGQKMGDYAIPNGRFLEVTEELMNSEIFAGLYLEVNPEIVRLLNNDQPLFDQIKDMTLVQVGGKPKGAKKAKYSCSCCNVWGKPGLQLYCRDCGEAMREQS